MVEREGRAGFGDFGEFVGGGFVVDRLAPAFEQGAAVVDLEADAVSGEVPRSGGACPPMRMDGRCLEHSSFRRPVIRDGRTRFAHPWGRAVRDVAELGMAGRNP